MRLQKKVNSRRRTYGSRHIIGQTKDGQLVNSQFKARSAKVYQNGQKTTAIFHRESSSFGTRSVSCIFLDRKIFRSCPSNIPGSRLNRMDFSQETQRSIYRHRNLARVRVARRSCKSSKYLIFFLFFFLSLRVKNKCLFLCLSS